MAVLPIPTTRVPNALASQRLVRQVQSDQSALFRIQQQLSTGLRIFLPSDDAPAALRAINLQRLIERKTQLETNVKGSESYLSAADSALNSVSQVLTNIRSEVLGVADTISSDTQRAAVIEEIDRAIEQLQNIGNTKFRDRYLFSGTRSQDPPYVGSGEFISYTGNEQSLHSYVDLNLLFDTSITGSEVFGGISADIRGTADLNPQLTYNTQLRDINGGAGLGANGALEVVYVDNFGHATSSVVDLGSASTVGDVARYIEQNAPAGSGLQARVTGDGLELSVPLGGVFVREVAEGTTARELGLASTTAVGTLVGDDITPAVLPTTPLDDLFGRRAQATLRSNTSNSDIIIAATANGAASGTNPLNGVTIQFVDTVTAGSETATYNAGTATLTIAISSGNTTANAVVDAINNEASGLFSAALDPGDTTDTLFAGTGAVTLAATAVTSGGSGTNFDRDAGIVLTNGNTTEVVNFTGAETVEDLLNRLNNAGVGLQVEINDTMTGLNVRSRLSGADLTIGENGGSTAAQLGIRSYNTSTLLADFNRGQGVPNDVGDGLSITVGDDPNVTGDGTTFTVSLDGAFTVGDVISRINSAAGNTGLVTASLATTGNGIRLTNTSGLPNDLVVRNVGSNSPGQQLGLIAAGSEETRTTSATLTSEDRHTIEVDGVFNTLLRMRTALENNDAPAISEEINRLDDDLTRVNFARSEVGARLQGLEVLKYNIEDEQVNLKTALSDEVDVDLTAAISEFTNRQYALQASLQTSANLLRVSLLDFL